MIFLSHPVVWKMSEESEEDPYVHFILITFFWKCQEMKIVDVYKPLLKMLLINATLKSIQLQH